VLEIATHLTDACSLMAPNQWVIRPKSFGHLGHE
jgi:hypothetical protein